MEALVQRVRSETLREAARVARNRHKTWRMPHPDDAEPNEVCDDISACKNIADAILALDKPRRQS